MTRDEAIADAVRCMEVQYGETLNVSEKSLISYGFRMGCVWSMEQELECQRERFAKSMADSRKAVASE